MVLVLAQSDLQEFLPEGKKQVLEARDLIVLALMYRVLRDNLLYTSDEIFDLLKNNGIDQMLKARRFPGLIRFGGRHTILAVVLNNLFWAGKMRKFAKDVYVRSGRPYGVMWLTERPQ